jgi:hypothetical protein
VGQIVLLVGHEPVAVVVQVGKADVHGLACICVKVDRVCRKLKVAETRIFTQGAFGAYFYSFRGVGLPVGSHRLLGDEHVQVAEGVAAVLAYLEALGLECEYEVLGGDFQRL